MQAHDQHSSDKDLAVSRVLTGLAIGGAVLAAGIVLAPYVLPALDIGGDQAFQETMWRSHGYVANELLPITEAGSDGLAGILNRGIANYVPFIGEKLAEGGWFNAVVSGSIGVGGLLLGNKMAKGESDAKPFKWGNVIKYASLATSALIALPVLLSGIAAGLTYLAMLTNNNTIIDGTVSFSNHILGISGGKMTNTFLGFSGIAGGAAHLVTCGMSMLPLGLSMYLGRKPASDRHSGENAVSDQSIVMMENETPLEKGVPCRVKLRLVHMDSKKPITAEELKRVETKKLHYFVVDSSLQDYQHIHPEPTSEPGVYSFTFTPQTANSYDAWADFTLLAGNENHRLKAALPMVGKHNAPPSVRTSNRAEVDGLVFTWEPREPLQSGRETLVDVTVTDKQGRPVRDLEPLMGTFASLAGFNADGQSIVHSHPMGPEGLKDNARGGPKLQFHVRPDHAGPTQFYVQVQRGGKDIYAPFGQHIARQQQFTARMQQPAAGHNAHTI